MLLVLVFVLGVSFRSNAYTPAETNKVAMTLLRMMCSCEFCDTPNPDKAVIVPDLGNPQVFFGMRTKGEWTLAEKQAAFDSFLVNLGNADFSNSDGISSEYAALAAYQCVNMNYTNALPAIRRIALNPTLDDRKRRSVLRHCIRLGQVDDDMTMFIESFLTNRVDYTWKDRRLIFDYADKVVANVSSNLVPRAVGNRAAMMFYHSYTNADWRLASHFDWFMSTYFSDYATSSNRLVFLDDALANTNISMNVNEQSVRLRFIAITNRLHSIEQPLREWHCGEDGE